MTTAILIGFTCIVMAMTGYCLYLSHQMQKEQEKTKKEYEEKLKKEVEEVEIKINKINGLHSGDAEHDFLTGIDLLSELQDRR